MIILFSINLFILLLLHLSCGMMLCVQNPPQFLSSCLLEQFINWLVTSMLCHVAMLGLYNPTQVTHKLGGENYVFWGGREGYQTLLNTDLKKELDHMVGLLLLTNLKSQLYNCLIKQRQVCCQLQISLQLESILAAYLDTLQCFQSTCALIHGWLMDAGNIFDLSCCMEEKTWLPRYNMISTVFYELNLNILRRKCPEVETDQMRRQYT